MDGDWRWLGLGLVFVAVEMELASSLGCCEVSLPGRSWEED